MAKRTQRFSRGNKRAKEQRKKAIIMLVVAFIIVVVLIFVCRKLFFSKDQNPDNLAKVSDIKDRSPSMEGAPPIDVQLLTPNEYSRPQIKLDKINSIVVHYIANPGSSAQANRDYFENLKDNHTTKASSHFIVGLEGEIIQCIPSSEIAYTSNERNGDTLSIETCHPDETGEFNKATYDSLVELTGWLCWRFGLTSNDVIRHYDVTGKMCPKYFVEDEAAWAQFLADVEGHIKELG